MRRGRLCLFAFVMLLLVCASSCNSCDKIETKTEDVPATGLWTNYKYRGGEDLFACFPFTCGLVVKGSAPLQPGDGTMIVGFESSVVGDESCGCEVWDSFVYRGNVIFDVSKFKTIVAASLFFDEGESFWATSDSTGNNADSIGAIFIRGGGFDFPAGTHASQVGEFAGVGEAYVASFPTVDAIKNQKTPFPVSIRKNGKTYEMDMTSLVKQWISGQRPNTGLVFAGRDESWPEHVNHANVTNYKNFRLRIIFNPELQK